MLRNVHDFVLLSPASQMFNLYHWYIFWYRSLEDFRITCKLDVCSAPRKVQTEFQLHEYAECNNRLWMEKVLSVKSGFHLSPASILPGGTVESGQVNKILPFTVKNSS
jgi:hypothetical protein